uniref:Gustatory receptor n=1 Tax=Anisakis simplex TaxID=6269 RepID=A0A0M3K5G9_ANISI
LFFGLIYLSATLTSMAIYYGYTASNQSVIAATVYGLTDLVQYIVSGGACVYALWRMRLLRFVEHSENANSQSSSSQELLDLILLSLGLIGELIYSVAGLIGLTAEKKWQALTYILLAVHITRLLQQDEFVYCSSNLKKNIIGAIRDQVYANHQRFYSLIAAASELLRRKQFKKELFQVGIQASLIFIAGKLRIQGDHDLHAQQPGKQTITFILVANITMFLMNLFEAEKAGISETVVNFYGKRSWVFLVRSFGPLTIFFRFHSSVCLAEIWKNVYAWKSQ